MRRPPLGLRSVVGESCGLPPNHHHRYRVPVPVPVVCLLFRDAKKLTNFLWRRRGLFPTWKPSSCRSSFSCVSCRPPLSPPPSSRCTPPVYELCPAGGSASSSQRMGRRRLAAAIGVLPRVNSTQRSSSALPQACPMRLVGGRPPEYLPRSLLSPQLHRMPLSHRAVPRPAELSLSSLSPLASPLCAEPKGVPEAGQHLPGEEACARRQEARHP